MTTPVEKVQHIRQIEKVQQVRTEIETELLSLKRLEKNHPPEKRFVTAPVPRSQLENWLRLLGGEPERKP